MGVSPTTIFIEVTTSNQSFALTLTKTGYEDYEETLIVSPEGNNYIFNVTNIQLTPYNVYIPQTMVWEKTVYPRGGVCFNAKNNLIYVICALEDNSYVVRILDPTTGNEQGQFATGTSGTPWGICCDSQGYVYVTSQIGGPVKRFTSSGSDVDTIGNATRGIKIKNGKLYCCNGNLISVYDLTTKNLLFSFGYNGNTQTGEGGLEGPNWLEATDEKIFVIDESRYIRAFNLNGGHQYSIRVNFQLGGICAMDANYLLYLDHQYICKSHVQTGEEFAYYDTGNIYQKDICTDGLGNFYISDPQGNAIRKFR